MGCDEDWHQDDTVGGCVPDDPEPYQMITVDDLTWYWDPDVGVWSRPKDAAGHGGSRAWERVDHVVYSPADRAPLDRIRIDRDIL